MVKPVFQYTADVDDLLNAFLDEFASELDDEQLDALTSGGFRSSAAEPETLPAPKDVDPTQEPQVALAVLEARPESKITPAEEPFVLPLLPYLEAAGQNVPPDITVLREQYDFFLVKYGLDAVPRGHERFQSLELRVNYPQDLRTWKLTPDTELESKFAAHASVKVGLDPSLSFKVPELQTPVGGVGGGVEAAVDTGLLYSWDYRPLKAEVIATGTMSSYSQWIINKPHALVGAVECGAVLRVPRGAKTLSFSMAGRYSVVGPIPWWSRPIARRFMTPAPIMVSV